MSKTRSVIRDASILYRSRNLKISRPSIDSSNRSVAMTWPRLRREKNKRLPRCSTKRKNIYCRYRKRNSKQDESSFEMRIPSRRYGFIATITRCRRNMLTNKSSLSEIWIRCSVLSAIKSLPFTNAIGAKTTLITTRCIIWPSPSENRTRSNSENPSKTGIYRRISMSCIDASSMRQEKNSGQGSTSKCCVFWKRIRSNSSPRL